MKNRILFTLAGGLLVSSFWWVFLADPGRYPILDYNRQVLAETEVEGYCAGLVYWTTNSAGSPVKAKDCRAVETDLSTVVDHSIVLRSFCLGAQAAGYTGDVRSGCETPIRAAEMWPTMDGKLTSAFDEAKGYPYPGDQAFAVPQSDSRTGTRDGFERDDEPSPTTTEGDQE